MRKQVNKNFSNTAQRRRVFEVINAGFGRIENLGRHPLTKGCNYIACVKRRKRILKTPKTDWKFKL